MEPVDFQEKLIAVVGVSADPEKYGHRIFRDLLKAGYNVVGVNPKGEPILGQTIHPNLTSINRSENGGEKPHLVITVVKPEVTSTVVDEAHALGIKRIWMQPGSESQEAVKKAKSYSMETVFDACFMRVHGIWE